MVRLIACRLWPNVSLADACCGDRALYDIMIMMQVPTLSATSLLRILRLVAAQGYGVRHREVLLQLCASCVCDNMWAAGLVVNVISPPVRSEFEVGIQLESHVLCQTACL